MGDPPFMEPPICPIYKCYFPSYEPPFSAGISLLGKWRNFTLNSELVLIFNAWVFWLLGGFNVSPIPTWYEWIDLPLIASG